MVLKTAYTKTKHQTKNDTLTASDFNTQESDLQEIYDDTRIKSKFLSTLIPLKHGN
jgi:hypothetical protein